MPRKQMPPKKQKRHKEAPVLTRKAVRRRKAIRNLVAGLLMLILVVVGIGYSINLLFRVKSIELQTPDGQVPADTGIYTEEIILAKLDIALDDHFLSFSTDAQEALLQEALPLLENIEVIRDYPDGVIIRLEPAVETYTMEIADGWLILSGEMHVMDTVTQQPSLLVLSGATPSTYVAGQSLAFVQTLEDDWYEGQTETDIEVLQSLASQEMQTRSDAQVEALQSLIESLEQAELLADITELTFDGEDGITFYYQDRITVLIGTTNSLEYKLSLAQYILWNENGDGCAETDTGVLDVSYQSADGTITTTFAQG
ncbi:MAG: FtsQ-type POTRA domain-containing protein [Faecalibacterium sp.]